MFPSKESWMRRPARPIFFLLVLTVLVHVCISTLFFVSSGPRRGSAQPDSLAGEQDEPWGRRWRFRTDHPPPGRDKRPHKHHRADEISPLDEHNLRAWQTQTSSASGRHALEKTLPEVLYTIRRTNGFYARDWSLWLGWNNMRYIIETALNHALLLNRTLVLPSFVYARDCEFDHSVCSAFAHLVNRAESGSEEWRALPDEDQQGWRIPLSMMLDLPSTYPVITTAQFLQLQGLPTELETKNGQFDPEVYLASTREGERLSLRVITADEYEPEGSALVDRLPEGIVQFRAGEGVGTNSSLREKLQNLVQGGTVTQWDVVRNTVARHVLAESVPRRVKDQLLGDDKLVDLVAAYDLAPIYEFAGPRLTKLVTQTAGWFRRGEGMRGWVDQWGRVREDVLWLQGEHHNSRGPGAIRFTSSEALRGYQTMVLRDIKFPAGVDEVADRVAERIREKVGGRMWMAVHMRRGDFVRLRWTLSGASLINQHLDRVKRQMDVGRGQLNQLVQTDWRGFRGADMPDVAFSDEWVGAEPPRPEDPFYLATDEKYPEHVALLKKNGALLLDDVLTPEDRQLLGPAAVLTDYVSLVEQAIMIRAAFFAGHAVSSVSGTVANQRGWRGCDTRTTILDS